jgi:hypothetical protein
MQGALNRWFSGCCCPRLPSPPPSLWPKIEKERKLFPQSAGSREKLPSSEGAGGIPGAGGQIKARLSTRVAPTAPSLDAFSVCHFPDSAEHVSCGCHAAGCRGAVGWAPGCPQAWVWNGEPVSVRAAASPLFLSWLCLEDGLYLGPGLLPHTLPGKTGP